MYSVIDLCGQQFKVSPGDRINIFSIEGTPDKELTLNKVLLFSDGAETVIGKPYLEDARVRALVVAHRRDDKVIVFKKRRRKDYKKKTGHRQDLTELLITEVSLGAKKAVFALKEKPAKKEEAPAAPAAAAPEAKKKG